MGKKYWHAMTPARWRWLAAAALAAIACQGTAAPPKEAIISRESQDLYRAEIGKYWIKTSGCNEHVYTDRVTMRFTPLGKTMYFRSGRFCKIERFLKEVNPMELDLSLP
jgi:hypothetical protein